MGGERVILWHLVVILSVAVVLVALAVVTAENLGRRVLLKSKTELRLVFAWVAASVILSINAIAGFF